MPSITAGIGVPNWGGEYGFWSTDAATLDKLRDQWPEFIEPLLAYREVEKLRGEIAVRLHEWLGGRPFDVIVLTCKAYDLQSSMDAIAPAVGPGTVIPAFNGPRRRR